MAVPTSGTAVVSTPTDEQILITRAFDAPIDVVWKFWTDPERLAEWFGPATTHIDPDTVEVELRDGGSWNLDMVDNETGEHYPIRSTLRVVRS